MISLRVAWTVAMVASSAFVCLGHATERSVKSDTPGGSDAYQAKFMERAIALSRTALTKPGSEPFAAVVVRSGKIVGEGLSQAIARWDVTSHGEVEAIRDANRRLKKLDLSDCEIYTTCEPCPLCVAAIGIARLKKMYYAASREQAVKAFSVLPPDGRFEVRIDRLFADERADIDHRQIPAEQKLGGESFEILKTWALERKASLSK